MDEDGQRDRLSLIPYPSDQTQIVLRHRSTVVLYDAKSKKVILQSADNASDTTCPYCNRPFPSATSPDHDPQDSATHNAAAEATFMDPSYFRMLNWSRDTSRQPSRSPSPKRLGPPSQAQSTPRSQSPSGAPIPGRKKASHSISSDAFSQNYFKTFFAEERTLGRGGYGVVLLVRHFIGGVDLGLFACKRIPVGDDTKWLKRVLVEVQLLQTLSHQNLVSYKHVWLEEAKHTSFGPSVPCAFVLMQYCNAGDLHHYIFGGSKSMTNEQLKRSTRSRSKSPGEEQDGQARRLPLDEIFNFFRDIASGLNYLHNMGYVHRDLKPSNCLLHRPVGSRIRCLLSDFGETQGSGIVRESTGNTGTISFCAPEVLMHDPDSGRYGDFTAKSDVYSLGIVLHLMCFAKLPYKGTDSLSGELIENVEELRTEIASWSGWSIPERQRSDLPDKLYKFLGRLLSKDPQARPDTSEILQSIKSFQFQQSQETVILDEAPSAPRRSPDVTRRGSSYAKQDISKSAIIQRRAHGAAMNPDEIRAPQTPLLMAPPERMSPRLSEIMRLLASRESAAAGRLVLFALKVWSVSAICSPFATRGSVFYLVLAAADLVLPGGLLRSLGLALAHIAFMIAAWRTSVLCELDRPELFAA